MTRCSWAGCSAPATTVAAGWAMCPPHHRLHLDLEVDTRPCNTCGCDFTPSGKQRVCAGCRRPSREGGRVADCGTHAAYERHRSRRETPCGPCRAAQSVYDRERYQRRGAA